MEWHCLAVAIDSSYVKPLSVPLRRILRLLPDEAPALLVEKAAGCKRNSYTKECSGTWVVCTGFVNVATGVTNLAVFIMLHVVLDGTFESRNSFGVNYGSLIPAYCNISRPISSYVITTT